MCVFICIAHMDTLCVCVFIARHTVDVCKCNLYICVHIIYIFEWRDVGGGRMKYGDMWHNVNTVCVRVFIARYTVDVCECNLYIYDV